jgi:uncharacterized membrane protein
MAFARAATLLRADAAAMARLAALTSFLASASAIAVASALLVLLGADSCCVKERAATQDTQNMSTDQSIAPLLWRSVAAS